MTGQLSLFDSDLQDKTHIEIIQDLDAIIIPKDLSGSKLTDLVPNDALLALTRNYSLKAVYISRILSLLQDKDNIGEGVTRDEITEILSMPKELAKGTINVMRKVGLLNRKTGITPFGSLIISKSPYIDDQGLLWLLHYILASNAVLVLWSNLFNFILRESDEITIHETNDFFQDLTGRWSEKSLKEKAPKEIIAIFRTYTDDLFQDLRLINKEDTGLYQVFSDSRTIPKLVWLSAILAYRDRYYPGASSLEVPLLIRANYSPGRIFRQSEAIIRKALDELHNADLLTVETRSGLDQIRFKREITWLSAIKEYLKGV